MKKRGLFIVLDGIDGSGKTTQTGLLVKNLKKEGFETKEIDFPQYGKRSAALVEEYLNGEFGSAKEVGPYRASVFYACDRYAASGKIKEWINAGKIVIANRYVTANMGHQGGKIADRAERKKFFRWLYGLEYGIFGTPRPDLNIILHVDAAVAQKLVALKKSGRRGYIKKGKRDMHERDLRHLRDAEKTYLEIADLFPDMTFVECMRDGRIMSRQEISGIIWEKIKRRLNR